MFGKPAILDAVNHVFDVATKYDISAHAAVLRWVAYHSKLDAKYGDGIVFSVSKPSQLENSLDAFEAGPLPEELAEILSSIWNTVKDVAPPFHQ
jgi:aflatoxin B1 aldehyde reductase